MEVTRNNFKQLIPHIEEAIRNSCFICIDGEFTGLKVGREVNAFDTPEEYYKTLSNGSSNFMLIQFGLCTFRWDNVDKNFKHCAFNFYLFPKPYSKHAPDRTFLCQSSSIDFLAAQGFDFNKLFCHGLPYLSEIQERKLRERLDEKQNNLSTDSPNNTAHKDRIPIPPENKAFINNICMKVSNFLDASEPENLEFDKCNGFQRKLIYQEIRERFPNRAIVDTKVLDNQLRILVVKRAAGEESIKMMEAKQHEKEIADLDDAFGFTKIIRFIVESRKLIVGHNMILDLLHTLNHFIAPLPEGYSEFKEFASCMFPLILDTKYMSSSPPFKDKVNCSALSPLLATLSDEPFGIPEIVPENSESLIGYCQTNEKNHEAGYDAFITGLCFLAMYKHILLLRGGEIKESPFRSDSNLIKPYINKLYLYKTAHNDSPYINLSGKDANPSRDHVFHLKFPKEWSRSEILQLFSPYGMVHIAFLDETSAYIGLTKKDQSHHVIKDIPPSHQYKLTPYKLHKGQTSLTRYQQLHWNAKKDNKQYLSLTPDRKRKLESGNSTSNGNESSRTANVSMQEDDGASAPKRMTAPNAGFSFGEESSRECASEPRPSKEVVVRKKRASSGAFTVLEEVKSTVSSYPEKTSAELPWGSAVNKQEESAETKRRIDITSAFKESDNWD